MKAENSFTEIEENEGIISNNDSDLNVVETTSESDVAQSLDKKSPGFGLQVLATMVVSLSHASGGAIMGLATISMTSLPNTAEEDNDPENNTNDNFQYSKDSWFNTAVLLAASLGCLASGSLQVTLGQQKLMFFSLIGVLVGWVVLSGADNFCLSTIARGIQGLSWGSFYVSSYTYVLEVSNSRVRGFLTCFLEVFSGLGYCMVNTLAYLRYQKQHILLLTGFVTTIPTGIGILRLPPSQRWLLYKNRLTEARKYSKTFKGPNHIPRKEFSDMACQNETSVISSESPLQQMQLPNVITTLLLLSLLLFTINFTQMTDIKEASSVVREKDPDTNMTGVISSTIWVFGSLLAAVLVDRIGRKPLFIFSFLVSSGASALLGSLYYDWLHGVHKSYLDWLPFTCKVVFLFTGGTALPVLKLYCGELLPTSVRPTVLSLIFTLYYLAGFLSSQITLDLTSSLRPHGTLWLMCFTNLFIAIIGFLGLPESRLKSFEKITLGSVEILNTNSDTLGSVEILNTNSDTLGSVEILKANSDSLVSEP